MFEDEVTIFGLAFTAISLFLGRFTVSVTFCSNKLMSGVISILVSHLINDKNRVIA